MKFTDIANIVVACFWPFSFGFDMSRIIFMKFRERMESGKATVFIKNHGGFYGFLMGRYAPCIPFSLATLGLLIAPGTSTACTLCSGSYWLLLGIINGIDWYTSRPRKHRLKKAISERIQKLLERMKRESLSPGLPQPA